MTLRRLRALILPPKVPNVLGILFLAAQSVMLPLIASSLVNNRDYGAVWEPWQTGVVSSSYIKAMWHLVFVAPLVCSLWVMWMRWDALEHAVAWTTPGYLRRYLRIEHATWIIISTAAAMPNLCLQGPLHGFAAFSVAMLMFYTLHPSRRRTDVGWFTKLLALVLTLGIIRPSLFVPFFQAQPLLIGVFALATVWYLRSDNNMIAIARGGALEGLGIDNVVDRVIKNLPGSRTPEVSLARPLIIETTETIPALHTTSETVTQDDPVTRWSYSLWRAPTINWIRAAYYESWVTRHEKKFPYAIHLTWWVLVFLLGGGTGIATAMALGWLLASRSVQLHATTMYPMHRRQRANVQFTLLLTNAVFILCVMLFAYGSSTALRVVFGAAPLPLDTLKGVTGTMLLVMSFLPFMHFPRKREATADVLDYVERQFPPWYLLLAWLALVLVAAGILNVASGPARWPVAFGLLVFEYLTCWYVVRLLFARKDIQ